MLSVCQVLCWVLGVSQREAPTKRFQNVMYAKESFNKRGQLLNLHFIMEWVFWEEVEFLVSGLSVLLDLWL